MTHLAENLPGAAFTGRQVPLPTGSEYKGVHYETDTP